MALGERVAEILADALRCQNQPRPGDSVNLTEREQDILALIALGHSNKLFGLELKIAEGTVKVHVKHLLRKLALDSRVEAAIWAIRNGFPPLIHQQTTGYSEIPLESHFSPPR